MPEQRNGGRAQDQAEVDGGQAHEVSCEAEKRGASRDGGKKAAKDVGNSRQQVEQQLAGGERKGTKRGPGVIDAPNP